MISLLRLLHALAAKRGDGLHPELCRRLTKMDAIEEPNAAARDMEEVSSVSLRAEKHMQYHHRRLAVTRLSAQESANALARTEGVFADQRSSTPILAA